MPRPELLETFDNPYANRDYEIHMDCSEFTSLCPLGGIEIQEELFGAHEVNLPGGWDRVSGRGAGGVNRAETRASPE